MRRPDTASPEHCLDILAMRFAAGGVLITPEVPKWFRLPVEYVAHDEPIAKLANPHKRALHLKLFGIAIEF